MLARNPRRLKSGMLSHTGTDENVESILATFDAHVQMPVESMLAGARRNEDLLWRHIMGDAKRGNRSTSKN